MGRPVLPKDEAKGEVFSVRVASDAAEKINQAIRRSGLKKPDWARNALIHAAQAG